MIQIWSSNHSDSSLGKKNIYFNTTTQCCLTRPNTFSLSFSESEVTNTGANIPCLAKSMHGF